MFHVCVCVCVCGKIYIIYSLFHPIGLIKDPMALYKESTRIASIWTEEEKKIFREKYMRVYTHIHTHTHTHIHTHIPLHIPHIICLL